MRVLIIGGSGSLGSGLTEHYIGRGHKVTVFSRDPHRQSALRRRFPNADFVLGDITRDYSDLVQLCAEHDCVINAAALKLIDLGEIHPEEFVKVNIVGAMNVARACSEARTKIVLFISTDKAVNPINLYGYTKAISESIFIQRGFSVLRYGNVTDSRSSFLEVWASTLAAGNPIILRRPDPTRFFLTVDRAIKLVDDVLMWYIPSRIYIPRSLRAFSIEDVARALGITNVHERHLLPGEKQHEVLLGWHEQGYQTGDSDLLCIIEKGNTGTLDHDEFCSSTALRMSDREIKDAFLPIWNKQTNLVPA